MTEPRQIHVVVEQKASNGLGVAGFVVSLVGLVCTLGVLSPLGLLLSGLAIFRRPRGFAVAGVLLGLLGTALAAVVGVALWMTWLGLKGVAETAGPWIETQEQFQAARGLIVGAYDASGTPPPDDVGNEIVSGVLDGWKKPFRYARYAETRPGDDLWRLESAGADGTFGTSDDLMYHGR